MNVLHVIPSVSATQGGPSVAIKAMTNALTRRGVNVTVATTDDDGSSARLTVPLETPVREGDCNYLYFKRDLLPYKVSLGLARWLRANVASFDIVHLHALFSFSSTAAARIARKQHVPYVVRPLGVLNRWGMRNRRRFPKLISFRLLELPILRDCSAIHYTSETERDQAALLSLDLAEHRCVIIPLAIEPLQSVERWRLIDSYPQLHNRRVILFLSRIDPMKGLDLLLDSFALVQEAHKDAALVIAGEGNKSYVRELQNRASALKNAADIVWTGHLSAGAKSGAFAAADVFVLPSSSENFGVAAAEGLAAGVPTVVSNEVGLSGDILQYHAGVVVKRNKQEMADAICDLLSNKETREVMAANGRRLAQERYSPNAVGKALHELYEDIISDRRHAATAR